MLKGKVAIVTGGTRGIGYEIVRTYLKNNAIVVLFGSREESVNKAISLLKEENSEYEVCGYYPDITNIDEVSNTLDLVAIVIGEYLNEKD